MPLTKAYNLFFSEKMITNNSCEYNTDMDCSNCKHKIPDMKRSFKCSKCEYTACKACCDKVEFVWIANGLYEPDDCLCVDCIKLLENK
jgi:hypothetical protein